MNEDAVSDVLGTILMVGITVTMMAGLSLLVLNIDGPPDNVHADLAISAGPGAGGWGTGDETILVRHLGGEAVPGDLTVVVLIGAARTDLVPTDQGWLDGKLRIGESWAGTLTVNEGDRLEVGLLDRRGFITTADLVAGGSVPSGPANSAPSASFTFNCVALSCTFDGTGSTDTDGTVTAWSWNFAPGSGTGSTTAHTFASAGTYAVTLTITDNQGATGQQVQSVTVALGNAPPTASFTFSCTALTCDFDGSASSDSDGSITGWTWNFDPGAANGETTSHAFALPGTYNVALTVTDNQGGTGQQTQSVTVVAGAPADPGFAYEDVGCDGTYDVGIDANVNADLADGKHDAKDSCLVIPASATPITADQIDFSAAGLYLRGTLTATNGDIDIDTEDAPLDMEGATLAADDDVFLHGNGVFRLAGIRITTGIDDIQIGWSNTASLRPSSIDLQNAVLTSKDDVRLRADGNIDVRGATLRSTSNGNNLHATVPSGFSIFVQGTLIDDQDDVLEITPNNSAVGTPAQGTTQ